MKHSYTVLLTIMLVVIAISILFPHSKFVEGFDINNLENDLDNDIDKVKEKVSGNNDDSDSDNDDDQDNDQANGQANDQTNDQTDDGSTKINEVQGADPVQSCAVYTSEDGNTAKICTSFKNKQKDNMDLVKTSNSVEDYDTTETFANWNPSW